MSARVVAVASSVARDGFEGLEAFSESFDLVLVLLLFSLFLLSFPKLLSVSEEDGVLNYVKSLHTCQKSDLSCLGQEGHLPLFESGTR